MKFHLNPFSRSQIFGCVQTQHHLQVQIPNIIFGSGTHYNFYIHVLNVIFRCGCQM